MDRRLTPADAEAKTGDRGENELSGNGAGRAAACIYVPGIPSNIKLVVDPGGRS